MTAASQVHVETAVARPNLDHPTDPRQFYAMFAIGVAGLLYAAWSIYSDIGQEGSHVTRLWPFLMLGVALVIALGFEFVNGFHDTANAVATVIYTHSLPAPLAVAWSGLFNFLGVLTSTGAVAFGIISLLPVELILQVGTSAGFAMVFALLIAAIIWNLGTWWLGLPASSSHTLIGSIIGVGVANALLQGRDGTSGVDWGQAAKIGEALLFSPLVGFVCFRRSAAGDEATGQEARALRGPQGRRQAAAVDPRAADPHLHRRLLRPWLQRRPEGHGPDHADPDRHGAHRLCPQPRRCRRAMSTQFRPASADASQGHGRQRRRLQYHRRPAARRHRLYLAPRDHRRHLSRAGGPGQ